MTETNDFASLRNLLALKRLDLPLDSEVDRFLIELHRRRRVAAVPEPTLAAQAWQALRQFGQSFTLVPSISTTASFAALALLAIAGLNKVQVSSLPGESVAPRFTFHSPTSDEAFALVPTSLAIHGVVGQSGDSGSFAARQTQNSATRFVLSNPNLAYEATAAF